MVFLWAIFHCQVRLPKGMQWNGQHLECLPRRASAGKINERVEKAAVDLLVFCLKSFRSSKIQLMNNLAGRFHPKNWLNRCRSRYIYICVYIYANLILWFSCHYRACVLQLFGKNYTLQAAHLICTLDSHSFMNPPVLGTSSTSFYIVYIATSLNHQIISEIHHLE